jgi:hypothetical protein
VVAQDRGKNLDVTIPVPTENRGWKKWKKSKTQENNTKKDRG